jgi:plasmid stabilization system protein ParE
MPDIRRTPQAEEDLIDLRLYIAQDKPGAADRQLDEIEDKFLLLAANPQLGPARPNNAQKKSCLLKKLIGSEGEGQTNLSSPVVK